jgi:3-hydroxyisobutyrate dehydrogenase-like beta-hydroxyacid dehydrogenase
VSTDVVGVVGAGRMGDPVVRRLLGHGRDVLVLVRPGGDARADLAAAGARTTPDVADLAACTVVLVSLFDDRQVRQVCLDGALLSVLPAGAVVVLHTTCAPGTVAEVAGRAAAQGVSVLDAPFSGGPHDIAAGSVSLFVGGEPDVVERVRPVLAGYADPVLHVGPSGSGQLVKLVNNALFAAHIGLLVDAHRLGTGLGVDGAALLAALRQGSADSFALGAVARSGSPAAFAAGTREFLEKDIAVVREIVTATGGSLGALAPALARVTDPGPTADPGVPAAR